MLAESGAYLGISARPWVQKDWQEPALSVIRIHSSRRWPIFVFPLQQHLEGEAGMPAQLLQYATDMAHYSVILRSHNSI